MKKFFLSIVVFLSFFFPSSAFASHIDLKPCIEVAHCVREEWDLSNIENSFEEIKSIIEKTPRMEIVEVNGDYLHAEATSKWLKYVDDLEISFLPQSKRMIIRSESRVGESDLGVNQKRVDLLKSELF